MHAQTMRADARGCLNVRAKSRYALLARSRPVSAPFAGVRSSFARVFAYLPSIAGTGGLHPPCRGNC